jgi:hypothetical protein
MPKPNHILFNVEGLSDDEIVTILASILINIDYGRKVFEDGSYIWEENNKIYFPKGVTINFDFDILNLNRNIFEFAINAKIYEIINNVLSDKFKKGIKINVKDQHITKLEETVVTFEDPLININYGIQKFGDERISAREFISYFTNKITNNRIRIIVNKYKFLTPTETNKLNRIIYVDNINDIIKFNIVSTLFPFKKHQILDTPCVRKTHPWEFYITDEVLEYKDGKLFYKTTEIEINDDFAYDEGLLIECNNKLHLCNINNTDRFAVRIKVKLPIKFEDVKEEFIAKLDPVSLYPGINYSELILNESNKFADNLQYIPANAEGIIFINDNKHEDEEGPRAAMPDPPQME